MRSATQTVKTGVKYLLLLQRELSKGALRQKVKQIFAPRHSHELGRWTVCAASVYSSHTVNVSTVQALAVS